MIPKKVWGKDPWEHRPTPSRTVRNPQAPKPQAPKPQTPGPKAPEPKAPEPKAPEPKAPEPPQRDVITDAEFEEMVERAIERIPEEFSEAVENCAFIVEAEPPKGQPGLLGLYRGHPLTSRSYYAGTLPDTITIYQGSLMRLFPGRKRLEQQVYRTVVHEIGHYFGLEEHELDELGWA